MGAYSASLRAWEALSPGRMDRGTATYARGYEEEGWAGAFDSSDFVYFVYGYMEYFGCFECFEYYDCESETDSDYD